MNTVSNRSPLLEVRGLKVSFKTASGACVQAVRGVDLSLNAGEIVGLVGESGCGKSTLARALLQLIPSEQGSVLLEGEELRNRSQRSLRSLRARIQMVFQDPHASLNPRMTVGDALAEPLLVHKGLSRAEARMELPMLLERVGLAASALDKYPHEFSGGQRQRIAIARALVLKPALIVADEPVSALDVSIQAQIINLFQELVKDLGIALLFISHDLSVVRHLSHRVAVMYLGRIVEEGASGQIINSPVHPYTQGLAAAIPIADPGRQAAAAVTLSGDPPSPLCPPPGCAFRARCPKALPACQSTDPRLLPQPDARLLACINP